MYSTVLERKLEVVKSFYHHFKSATDCARSCISVVLTTHMVLVLGASKHKLKSLSRHTIFFVQLLLHSVYVFLS